MTQWGECISPTLEVWNIWYWWVYNSEIKNFEYTSLTDFPCSPLYPVWCLTDTWSCPCLSMPWGQQKYGIKQYYFQHLTSDHFHSQASWPPELTKRKLDGSKNLSGRCEKQQDLFLLPGTPPPFSCPANNLITILSQACSAFCVVLATSAAFELHVDKINSIHKTKNEWVHI